MPPPRITALKPQTPAQQVGADIDRAQTLDDLLVCMSRACTLDDLAESHRLQDEILCTWIRWVSASSEYAKQSKLLVHRFERTPKLYG